MTRRAPNLDGNQNIIVQALTALGCEVFSCAALGCGFPDLIIGYRGLNILLEVKDGSLKPSRQVLTDDQKVWHKRWKRAGQVRVVLSAPDAIDYVVKHANEVLGKVTT